MFVSQCLEKKKEYHSGCKIINLLCLKEKIQKKREEIKANPKRPLKKWDKPHHLPYIIYSCNSSIIAPLGHSQIRLHFQKGIQLFQKPLKQRVSFIKDCLLLSNTGTPCLQKIIRWFKNWL